MENGWNPEGTEGNIEIDCRINWVRINIFAKGWTPNKCSAFFI